MRTIFQTSAGGIVYKRIENCKLKIENLLWLICQHSQHKGWVFPKGLVGDNDKNESMEQAALREVEEEGGVKAKIINDQPIKTQYSYQWNNVLVKKTVYYFLMEYVSGDPKNHDWEMMDAKFAAEEEVKKILTYPSDKEAFAKILQGL
ncbi:MAG: NUDIX domain-containing protein [Patescibacteria group bacterium]